MKKTILAAFIMLLVIGMATQASAIEVLMKPQSVALSTVIKPQASNPVGFIHQTGNQVGVFFFHPQNSNPIGFIHQTSNPIGEKLWKPTKAASVGIRVLG